MEIKPAATTYQVDQGIAFLDARHIAHQARHTHDAYVLGMIEQGIAGTYYQRETHFLPPNSVMILNPGEVHSGYEANGSTFDYRLLYIEPETFRDILVEEADLPFFRDIRIDESRWVRRLRGLFGLLGRTHDPLAQQEQITETINDFTVQYGDPAPAQRSGQEKAAVAAVADYLHEHYRDKIAVDDLSALVNLHRAYLIRVFRRAMGLPPYAYLLQLRIEHARQYLMAGMPIAEVALETGFADQSHFTRHFKRQLGVTPGQYRTRLTTS